VRRASVTHGRGRGQPCPWPFFVVCCDTWRTTKITTIPVRAQRRTVESVWRSLPADGREHLFFAVRRLFRMAKSYAVRWLSPRRTTKVFAGKNAPCDLCRALGQNPHGKGCAVRILAHGKERESSSTTLNTISVWTTVGQFKRSVLSGHLLWSAIRQMFASSSLVRSNLHTNSVVYRFNEWMHYGTFN
jgi:hypothetical protein